MWNREFTYYFIGRTVSLLGDAMLPVALAAGMITAGHGAAGVGYALAAWMVPMAGLVLFGGALSDKFTARKMMIGADLVRVAAQGLMAAVFLTGGHSLWQILVLQAVSGAASAMFSPGLAGLVPLVAKDVQRANASLRVTEAIMTLAGPALAGLLLALLNVGIIFLIDAATFAISAVCLALLRVSPPRAAAATPLMRALAEGWQEFRQRTWLWAVIAIWSFYGLAVFGPTVPLSSEMIIGKAGAEAYGWVYSAFGAGMIIGGAVGMRLRPNRPLAVGAAAMLLFALCPFTVALELPIWVMGAGHLAAGIGFAFWGVMWATTVQTQIPTAVLNRVSAYDIAGSVLILPIGRALAGPAAILWGTRGVLLAATVIGVVACLAMIAIPAIRGVRLARPALAYEAS